MSVENLKSKKIVGLFLLLLVGGFTLFAGNNDKNPADRRKELEAKRKRINEEIKATKELLNTTLSKQKATAYELQLLQNQVNNRQEVINIIAEEVSEIDTQSERSSIIVASLGADMEHIKKDYSTMLRHAYRYRRSHSALLFLFSSKGFTDAYRRWQYLKRYEDYRNHQAELITETQVSLQKRITQLAENKTEKDKLLQEEKAAQAEIKQGLTEKDNVLKELQKQEGSLRSEIAEKETAKENLNAAIEAAISNANSAAKVAGRRESAIPKSATDKAVSGGFSKNKGRLAWPISEGVITERFGTHNHPILKGITTVNNGLDFRSNKRAAVRSVYEGRVSAVTFVKGNEQCIIIQHGDYYTVYSNLSTTNVSRGDKVSTNEVIGYTGGKNDNEIHFEIWQGTSKINPESWLGR